MFAPPYVEYAFVTFRGPMALSSHHTRNCVRVSVMAIARLSESGFDSLQIGASGLTSDLAVVDTKIQFASTYAFYLRAADVILACSKDSRRFCRRDFAKRSSYKIFDALAGSGHPKGTQIAHSNEKMTSHAPATKRLAPHSAVLQISRAPEKDCG